MVLFPHGRITEVQRRMMTTRHGRQRARVAIEGTFDDCQSIVKAMFSHHAFRDRVRLSGVNSINWARIVAQAVYYFTAAVALGAPHRKVGFAVPTGNFGDVYAGYVARAWACRSRAWSWPPTSTTSWPVPSRPAAMRCDDVVATTSPSMDIQISSNFERLLFEAGGRDAASVRALMASLAQSRGFVGLGASADRNARAVHRRSRRRGGSRPPTIRAWMREAGYCADPHTAVALAVAEKETRDPSVPMVVLSTAHPAKFPDAVAAACGVTPALPDWLADLPSGRSA